MGVRVGGARMTDDLFTSAAKYPHRAGFKERTTSKDAADRIEARGRAAKLMAACRGAFQLGWTGTADELAFRLGEDRLSVRPRVSQLHTLGEIEPTGERRRNSSGSPAHVWQLSTHHQRRAG